MTSPRAVAALLVCLALASPLLACSSAAQPAAGAAARHSWTVAIYMSGDNTLTDYVRPNLDDIARANISDGVKVVALVDEAGTGNTRVMVLENHGYRTLPDSTVNSSWGTELDLGSGAVLRDFIRWAKASYPAERYALDLWGHGIGWGGVCMDQGDWLTMPEISSALDGQHLDMVSFDACQMGMAEVAYQMRGAAEYLVASEKDVPAEGWPYYSWLSSIDAGNTPCEVGATLAKSYMAWARLHSSYSATVSVVNLSRMDRVAKALDDFSLELWRSSPMLDGNLTLARAATERYDGDAEYDLVHFSENVATMGGSARLGRLANGVKAAVKGAVAYSDAWTNPIDEPANHANGLSIWLPFGAMLNSYQTLKLAADTRWDEFVGSYGSTPTVRPVAVTLTVDSGGHPGNLSENFSLTAKAQSGNAVIFEVFDLSRNYSAARTLNTGKASASFYGLPGGAYLAAAYVYNASGKLVGLAELPGGIKVLSWLYVNGTVTRPDGTPVAGAAVELGWGDGRTARTTTDGAGFFSARIAYPTEFSNGTITARTADAQPLSVTVNDGAGAEFRLVAGARDNLWMPVLGFALLDVALMFGIWAIYSAGREKRGEKPPQ